jgi:hypothetical protein
VEPFDPSTNSGLRVFDREHGAKSKIRGQRTARASNQSTVISESTGFASDYAMPRRSEIRCQITDDRESIMPNAKSMPKAQCQNK